MYKNIHNFVPFEHENLEFKNNVINFARNQEQAKVEGALTAVLVYANLVDYLAKHLLDNLLKIVSIQTFRAFGGVVFIDGEKTKTAVPLGVLRNELSCFEFPSKQDFLALLLEFVQLRNNVMHSLMQLDPNDQTGRIDKDIARIRELAEDILNKYNTITSGITAIWNAANNVQGSEKVFLKRKKNHDFITRKTHSKPELKFSEPE